MCARANTKLIDMRSNLRYVPSCNISFKTWSPPKPLATHGTLFHGWQRGFSIRTDGRSCDESKWRPCTEAPPVASSALNWRQARLPARSRAAAQFQDRCPFVKILSPRARALAYVDNRSANEATAGRPASRGINSLQHRKILLICEVAT